jgi:hypothetical protein
MAKAMGMEESVVETSVERDLAASAAVASSHLVGLVARAEEVHAPNTLQ